MSSIRVVGGSILVVGGAICVNDDCCCGPPMSENCTVCEGVDPDYIGASFDSTGYSQINNPDVFILPFSNESGGVCFWSEFYGTGSPGSPDEGDFLIQFMVYNTGGTVVAASLWESGDWLYMYMNTTGNCNFEDEDVGNIAGPGTGSWWPSDEYGNP